jgi:hypothetical protein
VTDTRSCSIAGAVTSGVSSGPRSRRSGSTIGPGTGRRVEGLVTTSVALRLTTGFLDNTLNLVLLFVVNANRADFRLSSRVDYLVTGSVTDSLGADVLEGPRRTLYGQFDANDRVYFTTTWRF